MTEIGTSPPTKEELESGQITPTLEAQVPSDVPSMSLTDPASAPTESIPTPAEIEETIQRLVARKNVIGVVVANFEGRVIKSTLSDAISKEYSGLMKALVEQARTAVGQLDEGNDVTFMRIRTKKHEIMLGPDKHYLLIVIQTPGV